MAELSGILYGVPWLSFRCMTRVRLTKWTLYLSPVDMVSRDVAPR